MSSASPSVPAIAERSAASGTGRAQPPRSTGQGLVEYGLILILIAVVAVIALVFFGDAIAAALNFIGQIIDSAR